MPPKHKTNPLAEAEYRYATALRAKKAAEAEQEATQRVEATQTDVTPIATPIVLGTPAGKKKKHRLTVEETRALIAQVQRFVALEEVYAELYDTDVISGKGMSVSGRTISLRGETGVELKLDEDGNELPSIPTFFEAVRADGGEHVVEWAAAAGVSVAVLRQQLREGTFAREKIVEENLGLVYNRLMKFQKDSGGTVDLGLTDEDLIQEGCLALLRSAEKFDLSRGIRFSTYATTSVWHSMQRAVHDKSRLVRLPSAVYRKYHVVKRVANKFLLETGRNATDDELSAELLATGHSREGMRWTSPPALRSLLNAVEKRPASFDQPLRVGDRDRLEVIGGVAPLSKPKPSPEGLLLKDLLHEDLLKVMEET